MIGLLSTPESYTQILNAIFSKKIINSTTTALMEQNHTPDSSYNWAYGYTNWLECTGLNECSNFTGVHSSPGLFGFYPWIDRLHNYFAIIATENGPLGYAISLVLGQRLQPLIVKALGSCIFRTFGLRFSKSKSLIDIRISSETLSSSPYESPFTSLSSPSFTSPSPTTSNSSTPTSLFVPSSSSIPLTKASVSNLIVYCLLFVILLFQMWSIELFPCLLLRLKWGGERMFSEWEESKVIFQSKECFTVKSTSSLKGVKGKTSKGAKQFSNFRIFEFRYKSYPTTREHFYQWRRKLIHRAALIFQKWSFWTLEVISSQLL